MFAVYLSSPEMSCVGGAEWRLRARTAAARPILSNLRMKVVVSALVAGLGGAGIFDAESAVAENLQKLSGAQIRAKLAGRQLTDEVHWRDVYERGGTFRSYAMGRKRTGKWAVRADELCIDLPDPDGGCFEVKASGTHVVMTPNGTGLTVDGVLQAISDPK